MPVKQRSPPGAYPSFKSPPRCHTSASPLHERVSQVLRQRNRFDCRTARPFCRTCVPSPPEMPLPLLNLGRVQCFAAACCLPKTNLGFETAVVQGGCRNNHRGIREKVRQQFPSDL